MKYLVCNNLVKHYLNNYFNNCPKNKLGKKHLEKKNKRKWKK